MSSSISEVGDILQAIRRRVACGEPGCTIRAEEMVPEMGRITNPHYSRLFGFPHCRDLVDAYIYIVYHGISA